MKMAEGKIDKRKGIDRLLEGHDATAPEEDGSVEVVGGVDFEGLMRKYEGVLRLEVFDEGFEHVFYTDLLDEVLAPDEVNAFLQSTAQHENHPHYRPRTGMFVSKLIQNSYTAGHNGFHLNTASLKEIDYLATHLRGDEEKPLEITITGDLGDFCGQGAQYSTFHITGKTGAILGGGAAHSTFNITGNAERSCGHNARHSTFNIHGDTGESCGENAEHSTFNIQGSAGKMCGRGAQHSTFHITVKTGVKYGDRAEHSTFKTADKLVRYQLQRTLNKSNRIIFIHPDGREEIVKPTWTCYH